MKKLFISLGLSIVLLNSCTTRLVSASKPYSDDKISAGKTYTFTTSDGKNEILTITKIDNQNIYGENSSGKQVIIEKAKISEIKKSKTLATVGLIVGVLVLAVVGDAYAKNKPVGQ